MPPFSCTIIPMRIRIIILAGVCILLLIIPSVAIAV